MIDQAEPAMYPQNRSGIFSEHDPQRIQKIANVKSSLFSNRSTTTFVGNPIFNLTQSVSFLLLSFYPQLRSMLRQIFPDHFVTVALLTPTTFLAISERKSATPTSRRPPSFSVTNPPTTGATQVPGFNAMHTGPIIFHHAAGTRVQFCYDAVADQAPNSANLTGQMFHLLSPQHLLPRY